MAKKRASCFAVPQQLTGVAVAGYCCSLSCCYGVVCFLPVRLLFWITVISISVLFEVDWKERLAVLFVFLFFFFYKG